MMKIVIDIDLDKKVSTFTEVPEALKKDPITFVMILHGLMGSILKGIHLEPVSPIVKAENKIVGVK
jgi:hypothetical protein